MPRGAALAAAAMLLPAIYAMAWPYRVGPLLLAAGLLVAGFATRGRWLRAIASAAIASGAVLIAQGVALALYIVGTSRSHDAPWPIPQCLAAIMSLFGAETTVHGPYLVFQTMRETHRLAATWDLAFDPVTLGFLLGGLVLLGGEAWRRLPPENRGRVWRRAAAWLAAIVVCWLPVRAAVLTAVYVHRVERFPYDWPLHAMNHYFSPWVALLLLAPPALLAWRLVRLPASPPPEDAATRKEKPRATEAVAVDSTRRIAAPAVALAVVGAALLAASAYWSPVGARKAGRVKVVDRHSTWSPFWRPYDTTAYGEAGSYNYGAAYRWLGQYYEMSHLLEADKIDDETLSGCDALVIKIPTARYTLDEAAAVVRFVEQGGGLLLIGDHTNLDRSGAYMNDMTRSFGFVFRDDLLFGTAGWPYDEHYEAAATPHPAVQHVPWFDFAVSCSVEPGWSWGRAAILQTGLWNMPPDYHMSNFHPVPQHCPEMRCGAFIQAWATHYGKGRVIAFTDSTIFSNFCLFQPGKINLLLDMIEWLNHANAWIDPAPWLGLLGLIVLGVGGWIARRGSTAWFLLLAGALCGWSAGELASGAMQRRAEPLPPILRPQLCVVLDRTTSRVPLAQGAFNEDKEGIGFGLFEQWIPRLGYFTTRAADAAAFAGDALVVICPNRPADAKFSERLTQYVDGGGRVLVIDSPQNARSTADSLLRPFGLSFLRGRSRRGPLALADSWPGTQIDGAWEVAGGQAIAWLGRRRVAAMVRRGKGLVIAMGFGSSWNDAALGNDWGAIPDGATLVRYDALFAMLRLLVEDKPIAAPGHNKAEALWRLRSQGERESSAAEEPRARPLVRQR